MKRKDGKRVKCGNIEYEISPHIMVNRNDALNMIELDIPEEPIHKYLNEKRKAGAPLSHLSVIIAAYVRVVGEFPQINRFIMNRKIYARNELAVCMVVLRSLKNDNGTTSKLNFELSDTVFDVNEKMTKYIETNRNEEAGNKTEALAQKLLSIPGLLRVGVGFFRWADKHGLLPRGIIDASPFHASILMSNLASIRTGHIFHHIYNFGTTSMVMTMGQIREVPRKGKDGNIEFERCIPFGIVMDERICSGSYYAQAFRKFKKYLANPELLETPPENYTSEAPYRKFKD